MLEKVTSWFPVMVWMSVIFYLSSQPKVVPTINPVLSYFISTGGHIVVYAVLYLLLNRALSGSFRLSKKKIAIISLVIAFLYGLSDEFHQSFVPNRDASLIDVGWDLLGGIIAAKISH